MWGCEFRIRFLGSSVTPHLLRHDPRPEAREPPRAGPERPPRAVAVLLGPAAHLCAALAGDLDARHAVVAVLGAEGGDGLQAGAQLLAAPGAFVPGGEHCMVVEAAKGEIYFPVRIFLTASLAQIVYFIPL